jgi:four helix bundle protein
MKTHKDLDVWKKGMGLVRAIYAATREFPASEVYGLTSQMQRAAVSIPSNIAEGAARGTNNEFTRFLRISLGSLAELETQTILAQDLGYIQDSSALLKDIEDIRRLTLGLIRHLDARNS